jgi:hypothetical protein
MTREPRLSFMAQPRYFAGSENFVRTGAFSSSAFFDMTRCVAQIVVAALAAFFSVVGASSARSCHAGSATDDVRVAFILTTSPPAGPQSKIGVRKDRRLDGAPTAPSAPKLKTPGERSPSGAAARIHHPAPPEPSFLLVAPALAPNLHTFSHHFQVAKRACANLLRAPPGCGLSAGAA